MGTDYSKAFPGPGTAQNIGMKMLPRWLRSKGEGRRIDAGGEAERLACAHLTYQWCSNKFYICTGLKREKGAEHRER